MITTSCCESNPTVITTAFVKLALFAADINLANNGRCMRTMQALLVLHVLLVLYWQLNSWCISHKKFF